LYLEYSLGERSSFLFVLSPTDFRVVRLPARREIEASVRRFLEALTSPPRTPSNPFDRHIKLGRDLFDTLLGAAREDLGQSRHVVVSPDGILHYLPFGALLTPSERYLIEDVTLSYIPSAAVLVELDERPSGVRPPMEFLGVAQPKARSLTPSPSENDTGDSIDLAPIPFAIDEIEAAAEFFPIDKRRVLSDRLATERAVKSTDLRRFRILHFATHALANNVEPEQSAIYLGTDSTTGDDGALRMDEILHLSLSSDLVVLSGCQTGLGRLSSAEGIVGLPWAFMSAGASSVMVSLWNINDRSTADLMRSFYWNLQKHVGHATALREAQKSMLASERRAFRHPFYWAPFILVGRAS
jgi:CHAT domain-containing protein